MMAPSFLLAFQATDPLNLNQPIEGLLETGPFLNWSFVAGIFITGLLVLWIMGQVRETRRLLWAKNVARAIRSRDAKELDALRQESQRQPWLTLWSDMMTDLGEALKVDEYRASSVKEDLGQWRERYQRLPIPSFVLDADRRITAVNSELCWMLARTEEELIGRKLDDVTSAEALDDRFAWAEVFASSGEGTRSRLVRLLTGETSTVPALLLSRPVFGRSATVVREYCVLIGLSGIPAAQGASSDPQHSLENMAKLAGCVAHDFNDVLTAIIGHGSLLQGRLAEDDASREDVTEIMEAASGARQLTDQLLAFSRSEVVRDGRLSGKLKHPGPSTAASSEDPTICIVEDDDSVRALVANAVQRDGFRVLAAGDGEEALEICSQSKYPIDLLIADVSLPGVNGPELYDRMRERYSDMKVLFTSGFVDEEVFRVELPGFEFLQKPFSPRQLLQRTRCILDGSRVSDERKLALIVDDEASTRRLLQALLESLECDCIVATNGEEALEKMAETSVDVVITDMVMPKMDGIQTCTAIQERFPDVKFIAMSGKSAGTANLAAAEQLGAAATLSKPFSKDELLLALEAAFGGEGDQGEGAAQAA